MSWDFDKHISQYHVVLVGLDFDSATIQNVNGSFDILCPMGQLYICKHFRQ